MALVLNDRVRETTSVVGTGAVNLLGYVGGYQAFSVIGNGNTCYYGISDQVGLNWEVGIGTYSSSGNTLVRTTVLKSSNSNNLVSFTAGTKDVFVTYPAETAVSGGGGGTYPTVQPTLNLDFANSKTVDPRITFVRNSTATYYDGQTSAVAEQNLLIGSQTIGGTGWVLGSNIVTLNSTTAPDSTTTASSITENATVNNHLVGSSNVTVTAGQPYTFSVYLKKGVGATAPQYMQFYAFSAAFNCGINVDLNAGTVYSTISVGATITSSSSVSVGSGWYRFIFTATALSSPTSGNLPAVVFINNNPALGVAPSYTGVITSDVQAWGAQLEQRSTATAYTPTTTAPITNYIPVLMTAPAGVPRLDYNPTTGVALGLLIEESRTNLFTYSSDFSNAVWTKPNATITNAANVAPDGTQTAQKLVENTVNAQHYVVQSPTCTGSTAYSLTIYAKAAERAFISMQINESGGAVIASKVIIDLSTGAVGTITALAGGGLASATATTTLIGNGWYRCKISWVTNSASTLAGIYISTASDATTITYTGNGYSGIYIWGAQLEAGSFATSYIPTVATTITRAADQASMTGTNFSSWYNQSQGSLYCNADIGAGYFPLAASLDDGGYTNRIQFGRGSATSNLNTATVCIYGTTSNFNSTSTKFGISYTKNLAYVVSDNTSMMTLTGYAVPTGVNKMGIGYMVSQGLYCNGHIRKLSYYPVALSSSNLVALTS
jgi:hypothetical protein